MTSRVIWGVLITVAAVLLVGGAVNRTLARSETGRAPTTQSGLQQRQGQNAGGEANGIGDETEERGLGAGGNGQGQGQDQDGGRGQVEGQGQGLGRGKQTATDDESVAAQGAGQGQGGGRGQGVGGNRGVTEPLAEMADVETLQGTVVEVNDELILLELEGGETFEIGGRAWRYALENGFMVHQNDSMTVIGFYDQDHFEPTAITNDGSGQQMQLREATGRPMWAGQGWQHSGT